MKRDIENGAKAESNQIKRIPLYCQIQTGPQPDKEQKSFSFPTGLTGFRMSCREIPCSMFQSPWPASFPSNYRSTFVRVSSTTFGGQGRKEINKRKAQGFTLGDVKYYPVPPP